METLLLQKMGNNPDNAIILHVDKTVAIEQAVKVMNIANENKFKLVLATKSK